MAYEALSFESGETLTSTKMNKMAGNDASFHDGTGIGDAVILPKHINFTQLSSKIIINASGFDVEGSDVTILSLTLEPGTYILIATASAYNSGTGHFDWLTGEIKNGSSRVAYGRMYEAGVATGYTGVNLFVMGSVTLETSSTLDFDLSIRGNAGSSASILPASGASFAAIRIG